MEFLLLGPVVVSINGQPVPTGPPKHRTVLAALLIDAGSVVSAETFIERIWGDDPPPEARNALYSYLARVRGVIAAAASTSGVRAAIVRQSGGYALEIDRDQVDLFRFRRLVDQARDEQQEPRSRAAALSAGLQLWRGDPLADVAGDWADRTRVTLTGERVDATALWANLQLEIGRHDEAVTHLRQAVARHPLAEPLVAALLRALYLSGQAAEALSTFAATRRRIVDKLGVEPGDELRAVHAAILRGDLVGRRANAQHTVAAVPRQLPGDVVEFTGRATELAKLDALTARTGSPNAAILISTVSGTAGVGKTALAVHWAHRATARFPDGQLYTDLRGYGPDRPLPAGQVLGGFLRSLGVDRTEVPEDVSERATLFRSLLAHRRVLLVLDNATDVEQVRPLLPGTATCCVIVTSRDSLAALVARHGAHRLVIDLLDPQESTRLLGALIGERMSAPGAASAAADVVRWCSGLPLALRIAAEHLVARPHLSVADLADELRDERRRLDILDVDGDEQTALRTVFAWSYRSLTPPQAVAFSLLGVNFGTDLDRLSAAELIGHTPADAARLIDALIRGHLVRPVGAARLDMHDLLRAYAAERAGELPADERRAALTRLLDHYRANAALAMNVLIPSESAIRPTVPPPARPDPAVADAAGARCWVTANLANLVAAIGFAADNGWPEHATQLATIIGRFLENGAHFESAVEVHNHALRVTRTLADRAGEATCERHLAVIRGRVGRFDLAAEHAHRAMDLALELGDQLATAQAMNLLGTFHWQQYRFDEALPHLESAARRLEKLGQRGACVIALANLTGLHNEWGRYPEAVAYGERALAMASEIDDKPAAARAEANLANAYEFLGRCEEALALRRHSFELFRAAGIHILAGQAQAMVADTLRVMGRVDEATACVEEALVTVRDIGDLLGQGAALEIRALLRRDAGDVHNARADFAAALDVSVELGDRRMMATALAGLAELCVVTGQPDEAHTHANDALAIATEIGDQPVMARAQAVLAAPIGTTRRVVDDLSPPAGSTL